MPAATCFPDNTVLINFGIIGRIDVLRSLLLDPRWCITVAQECEKSYNFLGLATYDDVCAIFGDPLVPTRTEHDTARLFQRDMLKPGDPPDKHMGEAETIAIASGRPAANRQIFVTDDISAQDLARSNGLGVLTTWQLLKVAHGKGLLTFIDAWQYATTLYNQRDKAWPPDLTPKDYAEFRIWITPPQ